MSETTLACQRMRELSPELEEAILAERRAQWEPKPAKYHKGTLGLFTRFASSPMRGAYLSFE
jgi:dihydroxy-acid dehydratase